MLRVALDGDDVNGFGFVRMHINRETEIAWQIAAHFAPGIAGVVAPHHVPMFLHEQRVRLRRMHRDAMNAMTDFRQRIGNILRMQTAIDGLPRLAAVITTESTRGRDRDGYSCWTLVIEKT